MKPEIKKKDKDPFQGPPADMVVARKQKEQKRFGVDSFVFGDSDFAIDFWVRINRGSVVGKIKRKLQTLWQRLTWIHLISVKPGKDSILKDGQWHHCSYSIKIDGRAISVDDVRVYNRLLTPEEIQSIGEVM